jgi:hypothetical protein
MDTRRHHGRCHQAWGRLLQKLFVHKPATALATDNP